MTGVQTCALPICFPVTIRPHLNRDKELPEDYKARLIRSWHATRVIAAAQKAKGSDITLPLYTAISSRIHLKEMDVGVALFEEALAEVGLDASLAQAMNDESLNRAIIESHDRGIALVGNDVGTPIISVGGAAFFGPVISPAPKGEEAGKVCGYRDWETDRKSTRLNSSHRL